MAFFFAPESKSVATLFGFVTLDVAGFFVVATVTKFLEGAFFVEFLFQPAQSAVDALAFFDAYFSLYDFHPLFAVNRLLSMLYIL